jgi:hypothetical protein
MSIERLQQEADDTKLMADTLLIAILKDIKDTPNDGDLGKKIRAHGKAIDRIRFLLKSI